MSIGLEQYLLLSAVLFTIGLVGALSKRNAIIVLMCIEIMLNAVNLTLVAFYRYGGLDITGMVFALFVMLVAAAEVALGLAIVFSLYRSRETVDLAEMDLMKW
ncbi:MAG: NADH-quinone oxidoreductase subunit NuoK [Dehalococcoidia bacterium]|mgnify:FL=1|jgi:NADH:ubiquinone oxidoreductase subunit K|nr:NADH-quinone oxidoreductase subunit NuoK [Dehalococcoidia bacterium]MDP6509603.1 NADH-quinone oxidoreductase subunit NuoK [Dehalococcoidia bacterium]MDP6782062.1 NADH-quinone oxidoreductase subunit NuoK [Dehalococcoidia bacterium]